MEPTIKQKKVLAIIPARGGSKSIPKKNIKFLAGKPLIAHSIDAAKESKHITKIVVSTDDQEIAQVAITAGAQVIERPSHMAQDHSPTYLAVEHAIEHLEKTEQYMPDLVLLLQPTSPLRTKKDIDSAVELFLNNDCESVVGVCELGHSVYTAFNIQEGYLQPMFDRKYLTPARQEMPQSYISNGAIFVSTPASLFKYHSFFSEKIIPYIMPKEKSIDIDSETDFNLTEFLFQQQ